MKNPYWKEKFIKRYSDLTDIDNFLSYSLKPLRKSIRVNTLKISVKELKEKLNKWNLKQIPWCEEGFFIDTSEVVGNTIEHSLGYFYVQGAISMVPPILLKPKDETILDMCAAPGSKTTQLAALMKNKGLIIANDHEIKRLKALSINLQRCGVSNTVVTYMSGRWFKNFKFDKVLVDAPCSGTGTIRKSYKTIQMWNPGFLKKMAGVQKQLLKIGFEALKENGRLVYSTCSLEPEENEGVISWLLENYPDAKIENVSLNSLKVGKSITEFEGKSYDPKVKNCLRIWPQDNNTEGFFICVVKKE